MTCAMTALRLIPLPIHSALEMLVGLALDRRARSRSA